MTGVAFDHRLAGTPEQDWRADRRLAEAAPLTVPGNGAHLLVLAAHPDDETLGAGGLIAAAAARGARVEVVVATAGEASHPHSPTHSPTQLAALRRVELAAALERLGPRVQLCTLGLPDGQLSRYKAQLAAAIDTRLGPGSVLVTPWRGDGHPDHEACALAARSVLRLRGGGTHWQYPIWAWHWAGHESGLPGERLGRVELDPSAYAAKREAIACHRSQHAALSVEAGDEAILSEEFLEHFRRPFETFVVEPAHAAGAGSYFDELYAGAEDPWGLDDRFYERRKRELILASLPRQTFAAAFEPGCATGLLTERLAERCERVLAADVAARALAVARTRLAKHSHVRLAQLVIPEQWPDGDFDLIVLSEVGYYCDDLRALAERVRGALRPDGVVIACHWRHPAPDHPWTAAEVHRALGSGLQAVAQHVETDFLLDVWSPTGASVAQQAGIVA